MRARKLPVCCFFSSRRRHTRWNCDWSSDVCSSDLEPFTVYRALRHVNPSPYMYFIRMGRVSVVGSSPEMLVRVEGSRVETHPRSEERRVGKECRYWVPPSIKKN